MTDKYYEALGTLAQRYIGMAFLSGDKELTEFTFEFYDGVNKRLPLMKLNRWLGYIQGTLIASGMTTVTYERDYTRPILRPLDFPNE